MDGQHHSVKLPLALPMNAVPGPPSAIEPHAASFLHVLGVHVCTCADWIWI